MSQAENTHITTSPEIPGHVSEARELLATAIECLIALLDQHEGDPDAEATLGWPNPHRFVEGGADQTHLHSEKQDGDNEPSLGWSDWESKAGRYEVLPEPDLEEQQDAEPTLGWQNEGSQRALRAASQDGEGEASLGWQDHGPQQILHASRNDCEQQCEDEGAEHDGREPEYRRPPKGYMIPEDLEGPVVPELYPFARTRS